MMTVNKYERLLTPSGMSDNGIWKRSTNTVEFPEVKMKTAIIEQISIKTSSDFYAKGGNTTQAFRVTIDGNSWNVDRDPREF